ncbi:hypothetical protein IWW50_000367 [Coemansia erecta]|nr:hypothetical protein GGF43_002948 [Coemansia sp. RSA 2618]KAJ2830281.1 hypothetical protein IWW50_000367 [Coemansia erecta]
MFNYTATTNTPRRSRMARIAGLAKRVAKKIAGRRSAAVVEVAVAEATAAIKAVAEVAIADVVATAKAVTTEAVATAKAATEKEAAAEATISDLRRQLAESHAEKKADAEAAEAMEDSAAQAAADTEAAISKLERRLADSHAEAQRIRNWAQKAEQRGYKKAEAEAKRRVERAEAEANRRAKEAEADADERAKAAEATVYERVADARSELELEAQMLESERMCLGSDYDEKMDCERANHKAEVARLSRALSDEQAKTAYLDGKLESDVAWAQDKHAKQMAELRLEHKQELDAMRARWHKVQAELLASRKQLEQQKAAARRATPDNAAGRQDTQPRSNSFWEGMSQELY